MATKRPNSTAPTTFDIDPILDPTLTSIAAASKASHPLEIDSDAETEKRPKKKTKAVSAKQAKNKAPVLSKKNNAREENIVLVDRESEGNEVLPPAKATPIIAKNTNLVVPKKKLLKNTANSNTNIKPTRAKSYTENEDVQIFKSWLEEENEDEEDDSGNDDGNGDDNDDENGAGDEEDNGNGKEDEAEEEY
ncbi:hypothetical protein PTTG_06839 [Puccinia triticina 1-1 BBBD Race 1]|uniref:Uncharacterized protein n=1 Tax=Puccinia triticina (isolate 1-1 / race 1 (BBBD)) TaxID=630390 RepID=A0A180H4C1_PUCT1|nr:hypothetical protein PTTG_06839 [Puccinia triticina 1-1 BBBD Race 1]